MTSFRQNIPVRFGHCDPAAMVYYPRYFEMINGFVEDWFAVGLEASFPRLLYDKDIMVPTVHFTVDFKRASHFGDRLSFKLVVASIGRTSCHLDIAASCRDELRMTVRQVIVFIDRTKRTPVRIPVGIGRRIRRFMAASQRSERQRAGGRSAAGKSA